jgi:hypothetical protein
MSLDKMLFIYKMLYINKQTPMTKLSLTSIMLSEKFLIAMSIVNLSIFYRNINYYNNQRKLRYYKRG